MISGNVFECRRRTDKPHVFGQRDKPKHRLCVGFKPRALVARQDWGTHPSLKSITQFAFWDCHTPHQLVQRLQLKITPAMFYDSHEGLLGRSPIKWNFTCMVALYQLVAPEYTNLHV